MNKLFVGTLAFACLCVAVVHSAPFEFFSVGLGDVDAQCRGLNRLCDPKGEECCEGTKCKGSVCFGDEANCAFTCQREHELGMVKDIPSNRCIKLNHMCDPRREGMCCEGMICKSSVCLGGVSNHCAYTCQHGGHEDPDLTAPQENCIKRNHMCDPRRDHQCCMDMECKPSVCSGGASNHCAYTCQGPHHG